MSFFDDASLVFLPSGEAGKDGKAYSMKPTNGNGDFTFSRGSNLTATRVDSNGLIEKGRENLFLNSDTPATQSITITNGGVYVLSFLGTGSVVASGGASFTLNGTGEFDRVQNYFVSSSTSVTLTISGTITEPQLELGLAATEYIESGASTGLAGLLEDSPRFDYSGGASCPSLLLEPSRTNLVGQSEYIDSWNNYTSGNGGAPTITTNYIESPEGIVNATRLQLETNGTSSTDASGVLQSIALDGSSTYIFSFWIKSNSGSSAELSTFINSSFGVQFTATTEWQRLDFEVVSNSTNPRNFGIVARGNYHQSVDVSFWGAQLEQGSYPTSYIPNHSGGSVTRAADVNTLFNQSGVIGQTAGTILFDAYFDEADKVNFSISDSTSSNYFSIETTSGKQVFGVIRQGGSTQAAISTSPQFFTEGDRLKCAIAYDDRDMAFYINGTQVGTAAPNLIPACDDIRFARYNGALAANQRVNRVLLFDTRISNGNLATLTS